MTYFRKVFRDEFCYRVAKVWEILCPYTITFYNFSQILILLRVGINPPKGNYEQLLRLWLRVRGDIGA
jgi:hypothetical protein